MANPLDKLQDDIKEAMKAQDKARLDPLRMLLAAAKNERIELRAQKHDPNYEMDEAELHAVVRRQIKQRKDSIEQFRAGGRHEAADKEEQEIRVLEGYLPAQASEDAIRQAIRDVIAAQGLAGPKGLGPIMKEMKAKFGASADGALVNRLAKELLG